jgi:hypothetical protein
LGLSSEAGLVVEEPGIGVGEALFQGDGRGPAQGFEFGYIQEFPGGAVGFGGVKCQAAGKAGDSGDGFGQFPDGAVNARAHIDMGQHGPGVGLVCGFVQVHHVHGRGGHHCNGGRWQFYKVIASLTRQGRAPPIKSVPLSPPRGRSFV